MRPASRPLALMESDLEFGLLLRQPTSTRRSHFNIRLSFQFRPKYQRGEVRQGQANGFKRKRLKTRVGLLDLRVPQVRGAEFYPTALERGSRSEKAFRLALAEM